MKFLDKKEQVMDTQLTQFGKYLLSKGLFSPQYYAFYDNDVLYDSQYGNVSEAQNDAQNRIKSLPQFEAQYVFRGIETEVTKNLNVIKAEQVDNNGQIKPLSELKIQSTPDKHYVLYAPLGTISPDSTTAASWELNVLQGQIIDTAVTQEGDQPTLKIPQLDMKNVEFKITVVADELPNISGKDIVTTDLGLVTRKFSDGSYVKITEDSIIIELDEINSLFENENFDIEVFESTIENVKGNMKEHLTPLYFVNKPNLIKNNILLDHNEVNTDTPPIDTSYVDYFFNVLVDDEIDVDLLCSLLPTDSPSGIFSQRLLDCQDIQRKKIEPANLYTSNVTEEEAC